MVVDGGLLKAQLGDGIGTYSVELANAGVAAGQWLHIAYTWSNVSSPGASLFFNGANVRDMFANASVEIPASLSLNSSEAFTVFFGNEVPESGCWAHPACVDLDGQCCPNRAGEMEACCSQADFGFQPLSDELFAARAQPQAYDVALSGENISLLFRYGSPHCFSFTATCPEPPGAWASGGQDRLNRSQIVLARSPGELTLPLRNATGTQLHLSCDLGFERSGGDAVVECGSGTQWVLPGSGEPARWLECCSFTEDFCPEVSEKHLSEYWFYEPCDPLGDAADGRYYVQHAAHNETSSHRHLGARLIYQCPPGQLRVDGSAEASCDVTGQWLDEHGAPARELQCETDEHFCPEPDLGGTRSRVFNVTMGQQMGSIVFLVCSDGSTPESGSVTLYCATDVDGVGGHWVDAFGTPATPLRCSAPAQSETTETVVQTINVQSGDVDTRYKANVSLWCDYSYRVINGDTTLYCDVGPVVADDDTEAVGGVWHNSEGYNAVPLVCEPISNWCPMISLNGLNSSEVNLTNSYTLGSIATLRCNSGFKYLAGDMELSCANNAAGTSGQWNGTLLQCQLAHGFCPSLKLFNASVIENGLDYKLGDMVSFECLPGFKYSHGDREAWCMVSGGGSYGDWMRPDGTVVEPLVCIPMQDACAVPQVERGYISSLTAAGTLGSTAQLRCHDGFRDPRDSAVGRVAVCLNSTVSGAAFSLALPLAERDLLRAVSVVSDVVHMLREHGELPARLEDDYYTEQLRFEARWKAELQGALMELDHGELVAEVLDRMAVFPAPLGGFSFSQWTVEHVNILHRLLVAAVEQRPAIAFEEARALLGAGEDLRVSFQPAGSAVVQGWLVDSGEVFGSRGNGYSYGWRCDVSAGVNSGTFDRNRSVYTSLENTLVVTDSFSQCAGQEWQILLPPGRYVVEVTVQDAQHWTLASGCLLQGEALNFPETLGPPGTPERRALVVDVVDFLTLSADRDSNCSSVNRISIRSAQDIGVANADLDPLLLCEPVQEWCPPFLAPANVVVVPEESAVLPQPFGSEVELSCGGATVYEKGVTSLFCGTNAAGSAGEWIPSNGSRERERIHCVANRSYCQVLVPNNGSEIASVVPTTLEAGAIVQLACRKGFRPAGGNTTFQCGPGGEWCVDGGDCGGPLELLRCDVQPSYCSALVGEVPLEPNTTTDVRSLLPLADGVFGDRRHVECPAGHVRVQGAEQVVCAHGSTGEGVWQPAFAATAGLDDDLLAEPVVCVLDSIHGVRRKYYTSAERLYLEGEALGQDVVPNIDQLTSEFSAVQFDTHLRPLEPGSYTLSVEVVGHFVLSLDGDVVLTGRSNGTEPAFFTSGALDFLGTSFYALGLKYALDPAGELPFALLSSRVRLLWAAGAEPPAVVPPEALYHSLEDLSGFPRVITIANDPTPCVSHEYTTHENLESGDAGHFLHGSPYHSYNAGLTCYWQLKTRSGLKQFNFFADFFDVQDTPDCTADSLTISAPGGYPSDVFCGSRSRGELLISLASEEVIVTFSTDSFFEGRGFNITWEVQDQVVVQ